MRLQEWASAIKRDVVALYIPGRDPRVPWSAKLAALAVAAYALSPIDLIPDFIPALGYLDDLVAARYPARREVDPASPDGGVSRTSLTAVAAPDEQSRCPSDHRDMDCRPCPHPVGLLA
jgi:hypothetical protein